MSRRDELAAEQAVIELEDELAAAKEYAMEPEAYRDVKDRLREARRVFRTLRDGGDPGEGVARPATVETGAEVH